jgi:Spy/CpxP family protein refolding chaperone
MTRSVLKPAAIITLAAGFLVAQGPSAKPLPGPTERRGFYGHIEQLAQVLNLTDSQKEQARTIFRNARESSQPVQQELRQNRDRLTAAAKTASEPDIQRLAIEQGRLWGQLTAIRTEASAKFYQILTPEQRVKYEQMRQERRQRFRSGERDNGPEVVQQK